MINISAVELFFHINKEVCILVRFNFTSTIYVEDILY